MTRETKNDQPVCDSGVCETGQCRRSSGLSLAIAALALVVLSWWTGEAGWLMLAGLVAMVAAGWWLATLWSRKQGDACDVS